MYRNKCVPQATNEAIKPSGSLDFFGDGEKGDDRALVRSAPDEKIGCCCSAEAEDDEHAAGARPQKKKLKRKRDAEEEEEEHDGIGEELNQDALAGASPPA